MTVTARSKKLARRENSLRSLSQDIYGIHDYTEDQDGDSDEDSHATTAYWAEEEFNFTI